LRLYAREKEKRNGPLTAELPPLPSLIDISAIKCLDYRSTRKGDREEGVYKSCERQAASDTACYRILPFGKQKYRVSCGRDVHVCVRASLFPNCFPYAEQTSLCIVISDTLLSFSLSLSLLLCGCILILRSRLQRAFKLRQSVASFKYRYRTKDSSRNTQLISTRIVYLLYNLIK